MGPIEATRTCLSKYVTFSGRASRPEYWWFVLAIFVLNILAGIADSALFGTVSTEVSESASGELHELSFDSETAPIATLVSLALFLPSLAAAWRRMHDTGRSGLVLLLPMVISIGTVIFLLVAAGSFSLIGKAGAEGGFLYNLAAGFGIVGIVTAAILQLVMAILILWWLTRPSQPGANEYGPQPAI